MGEWRSVCLLLPHQLAYPFVCLALSPGCALQDSATLSYQKGQLNPHPASQLYSHLRRMACRGRTDLGLGLGPAADPGMDAGG